MKIFLKIQFAVFLTLIAPFVNTEGMAAETPKEVVTQFCKLDFEGHRLNSASYGKIKPLILYPAEPGWDMALSVNGYEIKEETIAGNTAKVRVVYDIDRSWPSGFKETKKYEDETVLLKNEDGKWKISKYIIYPRVSSKLLCEKYDFCK